jgi:phospholipid-binding lipoprotein MlaA
MLKKILVCVAILFLGLGGCASQSVAPSEVSDSALESYNKAMFSFNQKLDKVVIRPVAKGYRAVTNEYVRQRVSNFFSNVQEPVSMANHLLQGEAENAGIDFSRFVLNTILGGVGLYDVAAKAGITKQQTDFDETMGAWCVPDGPFLILPVMGPSTPRAATGFVADGYASPMWWIAHESGDDNAELIYYGVSGLKYLNLMAENLPLLESLEEGSVDYYEAIKTTYLQNRSKIKSCQVKAQEETPDYDFDMDMEED